MTINLNDTVRVVLTESGAERLNSIYSKYDIDRKRYQKGDVHTTQLWTLIDDFGVDINLFSSRLPFERNEITIKQEEIQNGNF